MDRIICLVDLDEELEGLLREFVRAHQRWMDGIYGVFFSAMGAEGYEGHIDGEFKDAEADYTEAKMNWSNGLKAHDRENMCPLYQLLSDRRYGELPIHKPFLTGENLSMVTVTPESIEELIELWKKTTDKLTHGEEAAEESDIREWLEARPGSKLALTD